VKCDRYREAFSARLDGEPLGVSASGLEHHLTTCPDCARWAADATQLTRQARLGSIAVPDRTEAITAAVVLPVRRVLRRRALLRLALVLAGLAQLAIALPAISGDSLGMVMSTHAAHEAAAWNLAIGAAFLATALTPRRAAGLVPLLATFVVVLTALSVHDVAAGVVTAARLCTHLATLIGLLLVLALDRAERALPPRRFVDGVEPKRQAGDGGIRGVA
jgi:predicted anti-sigma-YlaC factor YlaD